MQQDYLGLFDTPPSAQETRFGLAIVVLLLTVFLIVLPVYGLRLPEAPSFIPAINAVIFVSELIIGIKLHVQAAVFRSRALMILASSYLLTSVLVVMHALTFPGAFAPGGLLGAGTNTTAWLAFFRLWAFPLGIIAYALLKSAETAATPDPERAPVRTLPSLAAAIALAAALSILATAGQALLPSVFVDRREVLYSNLLVVNLATLTLTVAATVTLFIRRRSVLDVWLLVSLAGYLIEEVLNLPLRERFSLGWYCLNGLMLVSNLIVMLALIAESNWNYARMALSTAARRREREVRLMSMEAVAAAIAHEIGQPLTAVTLSARAGLNCLTRDRPDIEMAIGSLRDTVNAGQRSFEVVKSVRAMFAKGPGARSQFNLNDLARETASLLDRELAAHHVSLQLALEETLPPVLANRVQMQRVLVNLLTNAIEAVDATRHRTRSIAIRSARPDSRHVLLQVSDSGAGIAPETIARIFDPFFTTKSTGTGLGLSLSRTIVEEHGGRLWASPNEDRGATFHLEMPADLASAH